ncbi:hypothetical protein LZP85_02350 [Priestia flexa]|jgi:hypothetical protein|uniref:Uncharacterized protein n=2 Tax=Priestia TaxID=2800373 RepID=A0A0V8JMC8_9BACI|nr:MULTISPECIES: hypothetical protein [Bacillaceae]AQX55815.1 hypothetical protein BC359_16845 [Priestia flexa]KSU88182.1 hypothetical protein AS180_09115 [Priestia veravalensis]KZB92001.1 hypothetical protein A2U94_07845 [Bacillus sp. VT 712]MBN8251159.1 hypothetical protein [Priestia flexa]MBN8433363.1 hypothetical protein [Priestia flexa]
MARRRSPDFFSQVMFGRSPKQEEEKVDWESLLTQIDEIIVSIDELAPLLLELSPLLDRFLDKK